MAATKCSKCGGIIPDGAAFCPGCGAPKAEEPPAPAPVQQPPVPQPTYSPKPSRDINLHGIFDMVFSKTFIILGVALGILLIWIGAIWWGFASADADLDTTYELQLLVNSFGFMILSISLLGGGIFNKNIDKHVRSAMVIIGGFVLAWTMSIISHLSTFSFYNPFS